MKKQVNDIIISKVAIKHNISEKIIESVVNETFSLIRKSIGSNDYPNILLHKFGRIKPSLYLIHKNLEKVSKAYMDKERNIIMKPNHIKDLLTRVESYKRICKEYKKEVDDSIIEFENYLLNLES